MNNNKIRISGRIAAIESVTAHTFRVSIQRQSGLFVTLCQSDEPLKRGDIVEISGDKARILTPCGKIPESEFSFQSILNPERTKAIKLRSKIESLIRNFFNSQNFLETRTPILVPCPGMETHIRTFKTEQGAYLPTSPEFAMKRLLVGGLEKIFQITPAFRDEPHSSTHSPEFTMLEWYRAYAPYEVIMEDTEKLFEHISVSLFGKPEILYQGKTLSFKTPWPRLSIPKLFSDIAQVDLKESSAVTKLAEHCKRLGLQTNSSDTWDDLYFRIWLNVIEPKLPQNQAVIVYHYPPSQAALSKLETLSNGSIWARRFEAYAGGIELANAFEELTDPVEQRKRFVHDMNEREKIYGSSFPKTPMDELFLDALTEGMPPASGIALGVDRLIMLFGDLNHINLTFWLDAYNPKSLN